MKIRRRLGCRPGRGQSGQAITEYLLLLTIIISVVFGILYQFNSAFRVYTESFFGGYVACLLETGELPGLGGTTSGTCTAEMKKFSMTDGKTHPVPPGSTSSSGSSSSSESDRPKSGEATPRANSDSSAPESKSADNSSGSSGSGSSSAFLNAGSNQDRKNVGELSNKEQEEAEAAGIKAGKGGVAVGNLQTSAKEKSRMTIDRSMFSDEEEKRLEAKQSRIPAGTQDSNNLRPKNMKVDLKPIRAPAAEEEERFSFGSLIRIVLILLIVIALLLVVGGQALQISKSWEKG